MGSRLKEDEKNERIIRGLLKLPENRRCINCNSLGPQYVCTSFWTFVCTTCSGIHREFTHRVKSVSMATFTSQEVTALQEGGNQRARDVYLKEWDSEHRSGPDGSNVDRLRDFIKHVYVERRFSSDKRIGKPPSGRVAEKDDSYDNKRNDAYLGGSRSPPYEDSGASARSDQSRYSYDERRSPGYDQESRQYNESRKSPAHSEVINDWRREDRLGNGLKVEDRRASDGDSKLNSNISVKLAKELPSPPIVRPVRELLGDNTNTVLVVEPKSSVSNVSNGSVQTQITKSSSTVVPSIKDSVDVKSETIKSLIDFDADPEPAPPGVPQPITTQVVTQPLGNNSPIHANNWASFDYPTRQLMPQGLQNPSPNSLEAVLTQISVPSSVSNPMPLGPGTSSGVPGPYPTNILMTSDPTGAAPAISPNYSSAQSGNIAGVTPFQTSPMPPHGGHWPHLQQFQHPSGVPSSSSHSNIQHYQGPFDGSMGGQSQNIMSASNIQTSLGTSSTGPPSIVSTAVVSVTTDGTLIADNLRPAGRKELPQDLFTAVYPPFPVPMPMWQSGLPPAMGYNMQYPTPARPLMPTLVQPPKSVNPFDIGEPVQPQFQSQPFPSMTSLQSALPNIPPSAWLPTQSPSYQSLPPALATQRPQVLPLQPQANVPFAGHHRLMRPSSVDGLAFGGAYGDQPVATLPPSSSLQPFSSPGGNPFG